MAVGATLLLTLFVVGQAFANSISAGRVADNAASLHWANAALGTAALTRAAAVQATTFVELDEAGLIDPEDLTAAMGEVVQARDRLVELREEGTTSVSIDELTELIAPIDETIASLEAGDWVEAKTFLMDQVEPAYVGLVDSLQAEQEQVQVQIDVNKAGAARAIDFIRFFLTLAIPASAVLIYRVIARRQVRDMRLKADLELEAERAIGRAKDEFIAGLSHELRTPLTSIYGFAEVLTDGGSEDPSTAAEMAQIIANEAAEMTRMVDDLLAAARLESTGLEIEFAPAQVGEVVESALLPFERAGLAVKQTTGDALVSTDAARLRHVLVNLVSNAARHGGPNIGVEVTTGDGVVAIEVWDDGMGVPEDRIGSLFDTFIHSGSATLMTGTLGLGLGVASRLTDLIGGKLTYQRFVGKTYFTVTLPVLDEVEEPEFEEPVPHAASVSEMIRAMTA